MLDRSVKVVKGQFGQEVAQQCREATALCAVLMFFVHPNLQHLTGAIDTQQTLLPNEELPAFIQPESLVDLVFDKNWIDAKADFVYIKEREKPPTIPFLLERIEIAADRGKLKQAVTICLDIDQESFWKNFKSIRTMTWYNFNCQRKGDNVLPLAVTLVQCCMVIATAGPDEEQDIREESPDNFVSFAVLLLLSMNWFGACEICDNDPPFSIGTYSHRFVVRTACMEALHKAAAAVNVRNDSSFFQEATCCLSSCVQQFQELNLYRDKKECSECGRKECINNNDRPMSAREERAKKRKLQSTSIVNSVEKLETLMLKLQLAVAVSLLKEASQRVEEVTSGNSVERNRERR
jgi:hypothetical protein